LQGQIFCEAANIIKMRRKSWKGFHNMASKNVFNKFTETDRIV
jgi:hypothetical protein